MAEASTRAPEPYLFRRCRLPGVQHKICRLSHDGRVVWSCPQNLLVQGHSKKWITRIASLVQQVIGGITVQRWGINLSTKSGSRQSQRTRCQETSMIDGVHWFELQRAGQELSHLHRNEEASSQLTLSLGPCPSLSSPFLCGPYHYCTPGDGYEGAPTAVVVFGIKQAVRSPHFHVCIW